MMVEAILDAMAVRVLKRAGVFVEMRVTDRDGQPQTRFIVRHHGVVSTMQRRSAVQLARTMLWMARSEELSALVWDE